MCRARFEPAIVRVLRSAQCTLVFRERTLISRKWWMISNNLPPTSTTHRKYSPPTPPQTSVHSILCVGVVPHDRLRVFVRQHVKPLRGRSLEHYKAWLMLKNCNHGCRDIITKLIVLCRANFHFHYGVSPFFFLFNFINIFRCCHTVMRELLRQ